MTKIYYRCKRCGRTFAWLCLDCALSPQDREVGR